jgi:hypothetical protein
MTTRAAFIEQRIDPRAKGNGKADAKRSATSTEALKTMRSNRSNFVPGIIVEGLILFAGKPKVGKSWMVLHAGVAVARSGFTLGDIIASKAMCSIARWRMGRGVCNRA